jgi:hypothetical protein
MLSDRDLWACAHQVLRQHGSAAPEFIAERIGAMVVANDHEGMRVWKEIARRAADLMLPPGRGN